MKFILIIIIITILFSSFFIYNKKLSNNFYKSIYYEQKLRKIYGLEKDYKEEFFDWLSNSLKGDFGTSFIFP